jgi:transcriptional regulator with XRE-family HTH domain
MPVFSSHRGNYEDLRLGNRLREERQSRKLTLGDVSLKTGLSIARLSQIETGLVVLDFETLARIASAFGVKPDALLPEERSFPYQITREGDVRSKPARRALVQSDSGELERTHDFWPLADLFVGRHIEPLLGRIANTPESQLHYYYHDEIEFAFVLKGEMEFRMRTPDGDAIERLQRGDCVIFRADMPHLVRSPQAELCESLHVFIGPSSPIPTAWDWYSPHARGFSIVEEDGRHDPAGRRLHVLRESRGWSLEETAEVAGLKPRQLQQIESGERPIPMDALMELTKAFGEPLRGFFAHLQDKRPYYSICRAASIRATPHRRRRKGSSPGGEQAADTYYSLASEFPPRSIFPCIIEVSTNKVDSTPSEHHGEEFIYVLEGELVLTTLAEDKTVEEVLRAGDSCFLDSSVPHSIRGETRNPYSEISATVLDVFWCPLGENYLFVPETD